MNFLKFTDFRNNSKEYLDKVENGDSFIIIRKGKAVSKRIHLSIFFRREVSDEAFC
jgi:antitoxin (DNA-binding transcriptional repressor) of toxin-antitoxin stability system